MSKRHNVFISYHHENDGRYKDLFIKLFANIYNILEDRSVSDGDIDPNLDDETIRQKIRDEFIRSASVTVVLIGEETWKRKHVDWEISASIRKTEFNPRTGLMGIILPTLSSTKTVGVLPPRLYDNIEHQFAHLHKWSENPNEVQDWIHEAFLRQKKVDPKNTRELFKKNWSGESWC